MKKLSHEGVRMNTSNFLKNGEKQLKVGQTSNYLSYRQPVHTMYCLTYEMHISYINPPVYKADGFFMKIQTKYMNNLPMYDGICMQ